MLEILAIPVVVPLVAPVITASVAIASVPFVYAYHMVSGWLF